MELIASLRKTLANVVTEYFHAHGFHWNVVGPEFAQLHEFFESVYEDIYSSIDPIAEILRKLNAKSPFRLSEFMADSTIIEANPVEALDMVHALSMMNTKVIESLNETYGLANDANEQGVCNFIAERIDMHKKWAWQMRSLLS